MIILENIFFHHLKTSSIKNQYLNTLKFLFIFLQNIALINSNLKFKKTRFAF